jgi:cytochrome c-type biogenesis protein CcmE
MDFERSEEITITGHSTSDYFVAEEILMKCPSKYIDEKGIDTSLIYSINS